MCMYVYIFPTLAGDICARPRRKALDATALQRLEEALGFGARLGRGKV